MKALLFKKSIPRYLWTRVLTSGSSRLATAPGSCLSLQDVPAPRLPNSSWVRVRPLLSGICGSDLSVIRCQGSAFLSGMTSFPFIPGHEVYGEVIETGPEVKTVGLEDRVVVEPALGCEVRGFPDLCTACRDGRHANCLRVTQGDIAEGLQTGFCRSVGGGWGDQLVAHQSQLHKTAPDLPAEAAVLVEPFSCAVHAVLRSGVGQNDRVLVVGCGPIGLLTVAALRSLVANCEIVVVAKHPHQRALAQSLGADHIVSEGQKGYERLASLTEAQIRKTALGKPAVLGGFSHVFECVGSPGALEDAVRWASDNGTVMMQGMPSGAGADLVPLWYKQVSLVGSYAYGLEDVKGGPVKTFQLALDLMRKDGLAERLAQLVRHKYPLSRYKEAIYTAMHAGRLGSVKTVFDVTDGALN